MNYKLGTRKMIVLGVNEGQTKIRANGTSFKLRNRLVFRFADEPETKKRTTDIYEKDGRQYIFFSPHQFVYYIDEAVKA